MLELPAIVCYPLLAQEFDFGTVREYLFRESIMQAAWRTLQISVLAQVIGIALGVLTAVPRNLKIPVLGQACGLYVWFFRGTPLLLQIIFWFSALPLYAPDDAGWWIFQYRHDWLLLSPFQAALIGLAVNEGAYMSEIVRGGIESIESGQLDASKSLGMTRLQAMRHVILPQAVRVIVPPTGNEFNAMLKNSSLASVISYPELLFSARGVYARNYQVMELLVVASLWYLFFTTVWTFIQAEIEQALRPERAQDSIFARLRRAWALPDRWTRGGEG
ncbi:MAG: amino acid ABC transporter permease [Dehalococcoidia bacterium]